MDIYAYEYILDGLKQFNKNAEGNYGNIIVEYPTTNTTFPHTVFNEIRNTQNENFTSSFDKVANLGYSVNIYAKTKGSVNKKTIARKVMQIVDKYLSNIGLRRVSYNDFDNEEKGSIYRIVLTYSGRLLENRRKLI